MPRDVAADQATGTVAAMASSQWSPMPTATLGAGGPVVSRIGLGLAALGRPAYITGGRENDLPTVASLACGPGHSRCWTLPTPPG